jgi:23S rRNA A2030 N6-methylase RlmJ
MMANRHFGNIADVWKHAALMEVLSSQPPSRYAESHAGSADYQIIETAEKEFGILRFLQLAPGSPVLARSAYLATVTPFARATPAVYPGSALQAMTLLGDRCCYLLCDLDPESAAGLRRRAAGVGLHRCDVAERDGMTAVADWLAHPVPGAAGTTVVHIDPFDPHASAPQGLSALALAAQVAGTGAGLAYWYGFDEPAESAWAFRELADRIRAGLWCGDIMVTDADGGGRPGDLGRASTPGTGSGMVLANVAPGTVAACAALGRALAEAYTGVRLPDGTQGSLVFTVHQRPTRAGHTVPA